jgi:hypothetical protein
MSMTIHQVIRQLKFKIDFPLCTTLSHYFYIYIHSHFYYFANLSYNLIYQNSITTVESLLLFFNISISILILIIVDGGGPTQSDGGQRVDPAAATQSPWTCTRGSAQTSRQFASPRRHHLGLSEVFSISHYVIHSFSFIFCLVPEKKQKEKLLLLFLLKLFSAFFCSFILKIKKLQFL